MSEFDCVIGYDSIKEELMWYCDVLKEPKKYKKLGVKMPSGLLLHGDPGVGKSLMADCFIRESGLKAYVLRKNLPNGAQEKDSERGYCLRLYALHL